MVTSHPTLLHPRQQHPTQQHPTQQHPTQLQLELEHAGEPVSAAVAEHLSTCPQCSQFLRTLDREREQLLASNPPAQFASRLQQAATRQATQRWWPPRKLWMALGSSIAMASTLAMAAMVTGRTAHSEDPSQSRSEPAGRAPTAATARQASSVAVTAPDGVTEAVSPPPAPISIAPQQLSMQAGNRLLAINPNLRPYRIRIPEELTERMGTGDKISPLLDICVTARGSVKSVTIVTGSIPVIDAQIPTVIPRWKYRPYLVDGKPEPFCYLTRYSIEAK